MKFPSNLMKELTISHVPRRNSILRSVGIPTIIYGVLVMLDKSQ